jgi:hypothetical protein
MTLLSDIRLLVPDLGTGTDQLFSDTQITSFGVLGSDNAFLAAALALETLASNEAMVYKYVKTDDLTVDGAKGADILLRRASTLRDQYKVSGSDYFDMVFAYASDYQTSDESTVEGILNALNE